MARNAKHHSIKRLVDVKTGLISREIFVDEAIYQQEQERVFARIWLFVGHESQVPKPGDYFVSCMGEESVILTRDSQQLLRLPSLWTRSYFVSTAGNVSSQTIQRYIAEQRTRG